MCDALGIKYSRDVWGRLDEDERDNVDFTHVMSNGVTRTRKVHFVNEPGLYTVILRSNSEKAKPFRRWVTHEVVPTIRKQGYYSLFSDEETIELITRKVKQQLTANNPVPIKNRRTVLDKINKSAIREQVKAEIQEEKYKRIQELWMSDFKSADATEFCHKLQDICRGDPALYHKYWDLYNRQKNPKFRGVVMI